jgi:hypothetical protein
MASIALVTLVTQPSFRAVAALTSLSQRKYASRLNADYIVLERSIFPHPHYDKWQIADVLKDYKRVIYLDADVIVRPDCPDLFVVVPPDEVGGENELLTYPQQAEHFTTFAKRLGLVSLGCPFYLNAGVLVVSACHRSLFREPEEVFMDLPWPEQTHFNVRLQQERVAVCSLAECFNDRHRRSGYLRNSYVLHYSCMDNKSRLVAAQRDLEDWEQLYRRSRENSDLK